MAIKREAILQEATQALESIFQDRLDTDDKEKFVRTSIEHFNEHVSPGWLRYHRSAAKETMLVEWEGTQTTLVDPLGNEFIDCLGGFGANIVGIQNLEIIQTVQAQLDRHALHNQALFNPLQGYLAKLISMSTPGDLKYVQLCSETRGAIELALNFARVASDNYYFISTVNAYHSQIFGAFSTTDRVIGRKDYLPRIKGVQHVEFGNADAAETAIANLIAVGETVAAVIVEPIQVAAGMVIPPDNYLYQIRETCDRYGVLLIIDETQTGLGRTGSFWVCEEHGVIPDILVFGKAIGGGIVPITGIVTREHLWVDELYDNPWVLSQPTAAGWPISCAAAIATIKFMIENDLTEQIARKGDYIMNKLNMLKKRHAILLNVRGKGLLIGLEFPTTEIGKAVCTALYHKGVLTGNALNNTRVLQLEPPGVTDYETLDLIVTRLDEALSSIQL